MASLLREDLKCGTCRIIGPAYYSDEGGMQNYKPCPKFSPKNSMHSPRRKRHVILRRNWEDLNERQQRKRCGSGRYVRGMRGMVQLRHGSVVKSTFPVQPRPGRHRTRQQDRHSIEENDQQVNTHNCPSATGMRISCLGSARHMANHD